MRIHPVVSVAQLEPEEGADLYNKERPHYLGPVERKEATPDKLGNQKKKGRSTSDINTYEVERIIGKRTRKYGRGQAKTEYRVKWLSWRLKWNQWIAEEDCAGSKKLIEEFKKRQEKQRQ